MVAVGCDPVEPLAPGTTSNLETRFLLVGAEVAERAERAVRAGVAATLTGHTGIVVQVR